MDCGVGGYFKDGKCNCLDALMISIDNKCVKQESTLGDCPVGSFLDKTKNTCELCRSNNDLLSLCEACTGSSFAECLRC